MILYYDKSYNEENIVCNKNIEKLEQDYFLLSVRVYLGNYKYFNIVKEKYVKVEI